MEMSGKVDATKLSPLIPEEALGQTTSLIIKPKEAGPPMTKTVKVSRAILFTFYALIVIAAGQCIQPPHMRCPPRRIWTVFLQPASQPPRLQCDLQAA